MKVTVLQEIEDLQAGLKETVKAVAQELDTQPHLLIKQSKLLRIWIGINTKMNSKI